jgi:hypothetical protein
VPLTRRRIASDASDPTGPLMRRKGQQLLLAATDLQPSITLLPRAALIMRARVPPGPELPPDHAVTHLTWASGQVNNEARSVEKTESDVSVADKSAIHHSSARGHHPSPGVPGKAGHHVSSLAGPEPRAYGAIGPPLAPPFPAGSIVRSALVARVRDAAKPARRLIECARVVRARRRRIHVTTDEGVWRWHGQRQHARVGARGLAKRAGWADLMRPLNRAARDWLQELTIIGAPRRRKYVRTALATYWSIWTCAASASSKSNCE